ncbi:hypothetical protein Tco_1441504, partial [Tanacetum coccineum]
VMAISVISVSLDSLEDRVGTPAGRVVLFGTIPTTIPDTTFSITSPTTHIDTTLIPIISPTIPSSPDYTPASPDYSPASDKEFDPSEDPSSDHIPPLPATSPFLSSIDDSSDSDIPDTLPSPTHGTLFTETALSTQSIPVSSGALRRRVMVLTPGQPIPHGRPYHYHFNGPVHMTTTRKRVVPLPTHRLAMRHSVDYSSSDDLSDSSTDHSLPAPSSGIRPSHHLCSLLLSIPCSSTAIFDRPSHDSSSVSPSRKRSRSPAASRVVPREAGLGVDIKDESSELSRYRGTDLEIDDDVLRSDGIDIDPKNQAEIDKCIAYADALRDIGIDARVVVEAVDREEIEIGTRGLVEVRVDRVTHPVVADDIPKPAQERAVEVTYETLGDLVHRFHDHTMEIPVHRVQAIESVLEGSGTKDRSDRTADIKDTLGVNEQIDRQMAGALGARTTARNLEPLMRDEGGQEEVNGNRENRNGDNGNVGNGN